MPNQSAYNLSISYRYLIMKISSPFFPLIVLCLFTICLIHAAAQDPAPVVDIDGYTVRAGVKYYILPVIRGRGGGVTLSGRRGNGTCLADVVQDPFEVRFGLPLTFHPVESKDGLVHVSTDANIKFSSSSSPCGGQSTVWKFGQYDEQTRTYSITTGGVMGKPGPATISNWFKIEKYARDYKLVFCPTVCNHCRVVCKDIGISIGDDGKRSLALTDDAPFMVMFKKA